MHWTVDDKASTALALPGSVPAFVRPMAIRFRDIDALDHVNHAVMLTYAETIRCDWFQDVAGYPSMANLPFIIASAKIEYKAPIAKEDPIELAMWVSRFGGKSWDFSYEIRHAKTKSVYATILTVQVAYDYKAKKTQEIPAAVRAKLEAIQA
jgi:acyl-CoA thioester hydrolase